MEKRSKKGSERWKKKTRRNGRSKHEGGRKRKRGREVLRAGDVSLSTAWIICNLSSSNLTSQTINRVN